MRLFLSLLFVGLVNVASAQDERRVGYFENFLEVNEAIDSIVVLKSTREMISYHLGNKVKRYIISLGEEPLGRKYFEGDLRTPEGLYTIYSRDTNSSFHTNLGISYPNEQDSLFALLVGMKAGGGIKIHGFPNNHTKFQEKKFLGTDWTVGCIAVSDKEVDELYKWVIENCPILILP